MNIRRLSFFALAVAIGASAFGLVWTSNTSAAATYCPGTTANNGVLATMCYKGSTYHNVPAFVQTGYLAGGGTCSACQVSEK
jgi:hypothetical protein